MKIILAGYSDSKKIISASSYLLNKYIIGEFEIFFLNYGKYEEDIINAKYISLDDQQNGGSQSWSKYLMQYISNLKDEYIIFSLDDYFLSKQIDKESYEKLFKLMKNDDSIVCCKLGISPSLDNSQFDLLNEDVYILRKSALYSATTQYCIWRREFLLSILSKISTPWEFEIFGSSYLQSTSKKVIGSLKIPLKYPEASSISSRHPNKISVIGNNMQDIEECINKKYLNENDLIMGQWIGSVKNYCDNKLDQYACLESCEDPQSKKYYKDMLDICLL